jgi:hypothetical protein
MGPRCYRKTESNPPACGLHNVLLVKTVISIDQNAPHLGRVACYVCPASETVVQDMEGLEPSVSN